MIEPLEIQLRFSDCDMMGHVNNACYLNYFEQARMHYFNQLVGVDWDWKSFGIILRKNTIEYLGPVVLGELPKVSIQVEAIGNKSFTLAYELRVNGELRTLGSSVIVCYNFKEGKTVPIYEQMRRALEELKK